MTNDQIIALIASLGAFFSALATFLTVRQIAKQREASYRPELVLSHVSVECSKDAIAGGLLPTSWVAKSEDSRGDSPPKTFVIPLRNVGLGTAKSVVVSWSLPFEALVKEVNEMAQRTLSAAYLTFENGSLSIKSESLGNITSIWKNQQTDALDYILPASAQHEAVKLKLPHAYILITSASIYFAAKDKDRKSFPEVPKLKADFEFLDIGERKHRASFEISFQMVMLGGGGEFIHGYLESKKSA